MRASQPDVYCAVEFVSVIRLVTIEAENRSRLSMRPRHLHCARTILTTIHHMHKYNYAAEKGKVLLLLSVLKSHKIAQFGHFQALSGRSMLPCVNN